MIINVLKACSYFSMKPLHVSEIICVLFVVYLQYRQVTTIQAKYPFHHPLKQCSFFDKSDRFMLQ